MKKCNLLELIEIYQAGKMYNQEKNHFLIGLCEDYLKQGNQRCIFIMSTLTTLMIATIAGVFSLQVYATNLKEMEGNFYGSLLQAVASNTAGSSSNGEIGEGISSSIQKYAETFKNLPTDNDATIKQIVKVMVVYIGLFLLILVYFGQDRRKIRNKISELSFEKIIGEEAES
ncbi:hypothetical protein [Listeria fleischmannii]|uniref:Uncharacterized protein n=1 Tax=Listeria fleischmannii FSL S10-1203 TaxID=1265822 RepID=W7DMD5_9LIST|nr:hypothetical protein [Listeria fleischmannii]EUJ48971.1 hypothetical protein MCOL2_16392 [Listeria fleischmannii FSL S10-1203]